MLKNTSAARSRATRKNRTIYQLNVTLKDIHPPIWRRFHVWEDVKLAELHRVLQIVMNWEDYHLHQFVIGGRTYGVPDADDDLYGNKVIDERRTRLADVVKGVGTQFEYLYDFGDSWMHDLLLEAIFLPTPALSYPRCLTGERCTPPEDVGGAIGYMNYLEAIADPTHAEHESMLQWRGPFDPESFSLSALNQRLKKIRTASRSASGPESPPTASGENATPALRLLIDSLLRATAAPTEQRKAIPPEEKVPIELSARECDVILRHTFASDDLTAPLRVVPQPGQTREYRFTLADLDELAGYVAAEANHAKNKKLALELGCLHSRIASVLQSYTELEA